MMRRKSFMARIWARLVSHQKKERLLSRGQGVLAAVSGGPDSVCLAHYLYSMRRRLGFRLEFAYVDHGLRRAAADEAEFVRQMGKEWGVEVSVLRVDAAKAMKERGGGLEEACRQLRYAALARQAEKSELSALAVGHQMDDQAETVLLNLLRGTRLSALGAMAPLRALNRKTVLIRPLLCLKRSDVLDYLEIHGLRFKTDETNRNLDLTRNWIRRKLVPLLDMKNPKIRERLSGLAEQIRILDVPR